MSRLKSFAFVFAFGLVALTAQSPAHATAGASVTFSPVTCTTNGSALISNSGVSCGAFMLPGESLFISTVATLTVFDEGLSGAISGGRQINPGFCNSALCQFAVPDGFEWAYAKIWVGEMVRDLRSFRTIGLSFNTGVFQRETGQDAFADFFSSTVGLSGSVTVDANWFGGLNTHLSVTVDQYSQSGVAPIPEPEIYAMMGFGLGLMGWVGRRRKLAA